MAGIRHVADLANAVALHTAWMRSGHPACAAEWVCCSTCHSAKAFPRASMRRHAGRLDSLGDALVLGLERVRVLFGAAAAGSMPRSRTA